MKIRDITTILILTVRIEGKQPAEYLRAFHQNVPFLPDDRIDFFENQTTPHIQGGARWMVIGDRFEKHYQFQQPIDITLRKFPAYRTINELIDAFEKSMKDQHWQIKDF